MQKCFLGCASYPEDYKLSRHNLVHFWVSDCIKVPDDKEWTEDLTKVSLIGNRISDIASNFSPVCPNLSTLLLEDNPLNYVPDLFFLHIKGLRFLSLTQAPIRRLPDSISDLENLSALVVSCCSFLIYVPPLTKLVKLKVLDLTSNDSLKDVPHGIEVLPNLRYLSLAYCEKLCVSFYNLITGLSYIEHLEIGCGVKNIMGKNLMKLQHLKRLKGCWFSNVSDFNNYIKSPHIHQLKYYQFYISSTTPHQLCHSVIDGKFDKNVVVHEYSKERDGENEPLLLPDDIQFLQLIYADSSVRTLPDAVPSVQGLTRLARIWIGYCQGLEYIWSSASSSVTEFESLVELNLSELSNFRGILTSGVPGNALHNLKKLTIEYCSKIEALFTATVISQARNLEVLEVQVCAGLKELISISDTPDGAEGENSMIYLPKLRILQLVYLPNLVTICFKGLLGCHHIECITIIQCPFLKKLPFSYQLVENGQQFEALKRMIIEKTWWETLDGTSRNKHKRQNN
ncbi:hypothetical protein RDABS01_027041 [Bienertia sinuspersici]